MTTEERVSKLEDMTQVIGHLLILHDGQLGKQDAILGEMRRENRMTRRIWMAIAKKQQLFDDEEWQDVFGSDES